MPPELIRDYQHGGVFAVLGARTFEGASDRGHLLARAHPSGGWIEWLSGEPAPGDRAKQRLPQDANVSAKAVPRLP